MCGLVELLVGGSYARCVVGFLLFYLLMDGFCWWWMGVCVRHTRGAKILDCGGNLGEVKRVKKQNTGFATRELTKR